MSRTGPGAAVLIMPREAGAWAGAQALWITARGWAEAAAARWGSAWIVTPDGIWQPDEIPRTGEARSGGRRTLPVPHTLRTFVKDLRLHRRQSRFTVPSDGPWRSVPVELIWEHHDLFNRAGRPLVATTGAPLVRYVHAPQVWEARKWGVRRPLWGRAVEAAERRHLQDADLVACVSAAVREQLVEMGVDSDNILIAPMGVDPARFSPTGDDARSRLGIAPSSIVVGWSGSFRAFHGLDHVVVGFARAAAKDPRLHLLLLGDGPTRREVERLAGKLGIAHRTTSAGAVAHEAVPRHLRAMDLAVVSSDGQGGFHYSPLKLREYAACGLPPVVPDEGELTALGDAGVVAVYRPGDAEAVAEVVLALASDAPGRRRLGDAARAHALAHWTWATQLDRVLARLDGATSGRDR